MEWHSFDTWIVVAGALSAMSCALLGNFLLLRKMSMMGDAISHAVLPGLAIAFLITGSRESLPMFIGACAIGALTALLIQAVHRWGGLDEGASMGVIFTALFAIGLILIRRAAHHVDLDPGCVLYGAIEMTPWDTYEFRGWEIPRAAVINGGMLLLNLLFVLVFYKELKISSFDPALATAQGINANAMHYILMTLVAATTVAAFESVGSILVIAMLIAPAAAARMLTDRLPTMLLASLVVAALCAALGHWAAIAIPPKFGFDSASTAGSMAATAGFLFLLAFLFAPRHGVLSRIVFRALLSLKIARDDVLGFLYRRAELAPAGAAAARPEEIRAALHLGTTSWGLALGGLLRRQWIARAASGELALTDAGRREAAGLVRSHRLWEDYLVKELGLRLDHVHNTAERLEHITDPATSEELARETGSPEVDPHGRVIPPLENGKH